MRAFSLIELSIVLVILGLLTGGILAGQSLIRAAELRGVSVELSNYTTSFQTFRDKYMEYPGDFSKATQFWGLQVSGAGCTSNSGIATVGTPGACDGNGAGTLSGASAATNAGEYFQFWRHLALAGLIEGNYSGLAGTGSANHAMAGGNAPKSRLSNGVWMTSYAPNHAGNSSGFAYDYRTQLTYGAQTATAWANGPILKPEEIWNLDTKMDDGKPAQGRILVLYWGPCTTATSQTDYAAEYRLSNVEVACAFYAPRIF